MAGIPGTNPKRSMKCSACDGRGVEVLSQVSGDEWGGSYECRCRKCGHAYISRSKSASRQWRGKMASKLGGE